MGIGVWKMGILTLLLSWSVVLAAEPSVCPTESITDSLFGFRNRICPLHKEHPSSPGVLEGEEISLQSALNMVNNYSHAYVAVLFYASWCPFSRTFRPTFSILSSLYPSIPHFAFEESAIRPRRYHGSRTPGSLIEFYSNVTGISTASLDGIPVDKIGSSSTHEKHNDMEQESCPFPWARSPENLFRQETYLVLATTFVFLRLLYMFLPNLLACSQHAWRRFLQNMRFSSLLEHPMASLKGLLQLFKSLKEPCKRRNLQGALNARMWASKSLATVSIGDPSPGAAVCL